MKSLIPAALLLAVGCADYLALTRDELDRHPPRPERRFAAAPGPPPMPAAGDWLLYRSLGPDLRGHAMDGWERVDVADVGKADIRLRFLAQTPSDQIEASAVVDTSRHHQRGHFLVEGPGPTPREAPLPEMGSGIRGWHHNLSEGPSRRRAVTPGLAETDYHCDEQLLVRVAALDLGTEVTSDPFALREDVAVPAGSFEKCVRFTVTAEYFDTPWLLQALFGPEPAHHPVGPVKIWIHPAVPATGVVKIEFPSGPTLELLDFGP
jgi:hypothetical protein